MIYFWMWRYHRIISTYGADIHQYSFSSTPPNEKTETACHQKPHGATWRQPYAVFSRPYYWWAWFFWRLGMMRWVELLTSFAGKGIVKSHFDWAVVIGHDFHGFLMFVDGCTVFWPIWTWFPWFFDDCMMFVSRSLLIEIISSDALFN